MRDSIQAVKMAIWCACDGRRKDRYRGWAMDAPPSTKFRQPTLEAVVPLELPVPPVTHMRTTVVSTSLLSLRDQGLAEKHRALLSPEMRATLDSLELGSWIPIDVAVRHFEACDRLGLTQADIENVSRRTFARLRGTTLSTIVTLAKVIGVTPWLPISQTDRIFRRVHLGGGVGAWKIGPKEALIEIHGDPLLEIPYYAHANRVTYNFILELFSKVTIVRRLKRPDCVGYRISWV
jgi:hypothetical protein